MSEDFEIKEQLHQTFDLKGFLFKLLSYWPLFLFCLAIAFGIAYCINVRKLPIYRIANTISIKDDQNPFFTTNTSLTFNWGGTTDKVNTAIITLRSRTHNEKVVDRLQYYVNVNKEGEYQQLDAYGTTPFEIQVDTTQPQILGKQFKVVFKDSIHFILSTNFANGGNKKMQRYDTSKEVLSSYVEAQEFSKEYQIGQPIKTPFLNVILFPNP